MGWITGMVTVQKLVCASCSFRVTIALDRFFFSSRGLFRRADVDDTQTAATMRSSLRSQSGSDCQYRI
jgi:hypothetical protein